MKLGSKVKWVKDFRMDLDAFWWQGLDMQAFSGLSINEVKHILKCMAWRRAREGWREETRARPKLEVMRRLMDCECKARCAEIDCKRQRRMLMKLRGGTAELRIETSPVYTRPSGVETGLTKPVSTPFYVRLHSSS